MSTNDHLDLSGASPKASVFRMLGASNHTDDEREEHDYYATDPDAVRQLLNAESFATKIWEPAVGGGHISRVLELSGHSVLSTDLVFRGYGKTEPLDFLQYDGEPFDGDIITNPPYRLGAEFVAKALETITVGHKAAMLLRLQFLESEKRRCLFREHPPHTVYVFSKRVKCAKNGDFDNTGSSAIAYAWFVWEKGFKGDPTIRWL